MSEFDSPPDANLRIGRIAGALGLGAVVGGGVTILVFALSANVLPNAGPGMEATAALSAGVVGTWLILGLIAIAGWGLGLVVIGGPAWFLAHGMGLRARFHAMIIGALLAGVAGYVFGVLALAPYPTAWFLVFSLIGMGVGWIIWSLTYGSKSRTLAAAG